LPLARPQPTWPMHLAWRRCRLPLPEHVKLIWPPASPKRHANWPHRRP